MYISSNKVLKRNGWIVHISIKVYLNFQCIILGCSTKCKKGANRHLGATLKCWQTTKSWSTSGGRFKMQKKMSLYREQSAKHSFAGKNSQQLFSHWDKFVSPKYYTNIIMPHEYRWDDILPQWCIVLSSELW